MVQNLVSNAIKYAPGARVLVGVRRHGPTLSIVVADTGPGIAERDQGRIFDEFVQIRRPDEDVDGLGLGLSIVRRLAEMQNLTVAVASKPGRGARFSINGLLPVPARNEVHAPSMRHEHRLMRMRVLVVDDDRTIRDSTARLLSRWGCSVQATSRIAQADTLTEFDFLLCDEYLGEDGSGVDLILRIRERAGRLIPAAIVTGGRLDGLVAVCQSHSISLLAKPVRPRQLRSVLIAGLLGQDSPSSVATLAAAVRVDTPSVRNSAET
jgi:CheY-like chemotaxis protein